jgi:hypothetical protein
MTSNTEQKLSHTPVYIINSGGSSMHNTLRVLEEKLLKGALPTERVVLRLPDSVPYSYTMDQIKVRHMPKLRAYDDDSKDVINLPSLQEACAETLRSTADVDISLPTGFIIFEVPEIAEGVTMSASTIEPICFLTVDELYNYLDASNASPIQQHPDRDSLWDGLEVSSTNGFLESSMRFTAKHYYVESELEEVVKYLKATIARQRCSLKKVKSSEIVKIDIYVMANMPCVIPIIPNNPLFTAPVSKQRLLYIHDMIRAWIAETQCMWVEIDTVSAVSKTFATFRYKYCRKNAWEPLPVTALTKTKILRGLYLPGTVCWKRFTTLDLDTLPNIMNSALTFLQDAGIDMNLDSFAGNMEDYLPKRETTIDVPKRPDTTTVVLAKRSTTYSDRHQEGRQDDDTTHSQRLDILANMRGGGRHRGGSESRGRGYHAEHGSHESRGHRAERGEHEGRIPRTEQGSRGFHNTERGGYEGRGRGSHVERGGYEGRGRGTHVERGGYEGRGRGTHVERGGYEGRGRGTHPERGGFEGRGRGTHVERGDYEGRGRGVHAERGGYEGRGRGSHDVESAARHRVRGGRV